MTYFNLYTANNKKGQVVFLGKLKIDLHVSDYDTSLTK